MCSKSPAEMIDHVVKSLENEHGHVFVRNLCLTMSLDAEGKLTGKHTGSVLNFKITRYKEL